MTTLHLRERERERERGGETANLPVPDNILSIKLFELGILFTVDLRSSHWHYVLTTPENIYGYAVSILIRSYRLWE